MYRRPPGVVFCPRGAVSGVSICVLLRRKRVCKSRFTPVGLSVAALPHSIYVVVRFPACQPADHTATAAARSPRAKVIGVVLASIVRRQPDERSARLMRARTSHIERRRAC